jgi:hypothetical protein
MTWTTSLHKFTIFSRKDFYGSLETPHDDLDDSRRRIGGSTRQGPWGDGLHQLDTMAKMSAWEDPRSGYSRSIEFIYNGTNWLEIARTAQDVPN